MTHRQANISNCGILLDSLLVVLAFVLAYHIKKYFLPLHSGLATDPNYYLILFCALFSCAISFDLFQVSNRYKIYSFNGFVFKVTGAVLASLAGLVLILYLLKIESVSRLLLVMYALLLIALMLSCRYLMIYSSRRSKQNNFASNVLIIGSRDRAKELVQYLCETQNNDCHIKGCLDAAEDKDRVGVTVYGAVQVIGTMDDFEAILMDSVVDEVIFAMPLKKIENVVASISFAETLGVNVRILPDWQLQKLMYQPAVGSVAVESFIGIPTLVLSSLPQKKFELVLKSLFDRVVAIASLIVLLPLFVFFAIAIKLSSRGPVFFHQVRSGLNGREFLLYKFRTMVANAEELRDGLLQDNEMDGPVFKIKNDPRITKIGNLLRKTSLDELPQLINIAKGEMSFVGPRPPLPSEVKDYEVWQRRRLSMKPGLTCTWQVSGRNEISFDQWMHMDLDYIDSWSLLTDFKLIFKTVPAVILGTGR